MYFCFDKCCFWVIALTIVLHMVFWSWTFIMDQYKEGSHNISCKTSCLPTHFHAIPSHFQWKKFSIGQVWLYGGLYTVSYQKIDAGITLLLLHYWCFAISLDYHK